MRPTAKDPSQFEFPVGPKVPYEDPKRCVSLRAATKREACKSTKLCTKQGHGWKLFISGTPTKRTLLVQLAHLMNNHTLASRGFEPAFLIGIGNLST